MLNSIKERVDDLGMTAIIHRPPRRKKKN